MPLSLKATDRLFDRLSATYGREFMARYDGNAPAAVKAIWMHELDAFGDHLDMLAWALENLPERAPNAVEFRNLARRAPAAPAVALPLPAADPERVRTEMEKLRGTADAPVARDRLGWARRVVERANAGERISRFAVSMATDALKRMGATT